MGPWTQSTPSPEFERSFMQYHWAQRANWSAEPVVARPRGPPGGPRRPGRGDEHGRRGLRAHANERARLVRPRPEWRGRALGREAREAIPHLLFEGPPLAEARSSCLTCQCSLARPWPQPGHPRRRDAPDRRGRRRARDCDAPPPHPRALAPADRPSCSRAWRSASRSSSSLAAAAHRGERVDDAVAVEPVELRRALARRRVLRGVGRPGRVGLTRGAGQAWSVAVRRSTRSTRSGAASARRCGGRARRTRPRSAPRRRPRAARPSRCPGCTGSTPRPA